MGGVGNDADGNQTSLGGSGLPSLACSYDELGQMSQVTTGLACVFRYDGLGRRVLKSATLPGKTFYVFDGDLLLGEVSVPFVGQPFAAAAYTWGAAGLVSERLVSESRSLWYHFGPQGETRQLTNSSGNTVDTYVYRAYGVPVVTSGSDPNPFRYGGQVGYYTESQAASGALVLCGARWYQPNEGRWLSRDPIGYRGGPNLYEYCDGDPVGLTDPEGVWGKGVHFHLTYQWLRELGLPREAAWYIALYDWYTDLDAADDPAPQFPTTDYHKARPSGWGGDNRCHTRRAEYANAQQVAALMRGPRTGLRYRVFEHLGHALHTIQDQSAHGNAWGHTGRDNPNLDWNLRPNKARPRIDQARNDTRAFIRKALADKAIGPVLRRARQTRPGLNTRRTGCPR